MVKRIQPLLLIAISLILLSGCSVRKESAVDKPLAVQLTVSRDFSSENIFDKQILVEAGETVLDILEKNLEVETSAGGFVNGINGFKSSIQEQSGKDWFYYVNGTASNCSSKDYHLKAGDKVLWDYHKWDGNSFIPAIIGSYPEPFINGFQGKTKGTRIYYADACKNEALRIKKSLEGLKVKNISEAPLDESFETEDGFPSIIIGEYGSLVRNKNIAKLLSNGENKGIFVRFGKKEIELLDYSGLVKRASESSAGVLCAAAGSLGDTAPVWIITSIEHKGIEDITDLICTKPESIKNCYGAAFNKGRLERLPTK